MLRLPRQLALAVMLLAIASSADAVNERMTYIPYVPEAKAVCSDGTENGFFFRQSTLGPQATKWMVYLEGGGACRSEASCRQRSKIKRLWSSPATTEGKVMTAGVFDASEKRNPFAEFHHVFVPYCTSDEYSGNMHHDWHGLNAHFYGERTVPALLDTLQQSSLPGGAVWDKATSVLFTGSSAGSVGAAYNWNYFRHRVGRAGRRLKLLLDSSWFVDSSMSDDECYAMTHHHPYRWTSQFIERVSVWWDPNAPIPMHQYNHCAEAHRYQCAMTPSLIGYLEAPDDIFVVSASTDALTVGRYTNNPPPSSFVQTLADDAKAALVPHVRNAALFQCTQHTILMTRTYSFDLTINGVNVMQAIADWFYDKSKNTMLLDSCTGTNCNPLCHHD